MKSKKIVMIMIKITMIKWSMKNKKELPSGLQKKLERGGTLPPGWQDKLAKGQIVDKMF